MEIIRKEKKLFQESQSENKTEISNKEESCNQLFDKSQPQQSEKMEKEMSRPKSEKSMDKSSSWAVNFTLNEDHELKKRQQFWIK